MRMTRQEDRLAPRRRRPSPHRYDHAGGKCDDQRRWCAVAGATSNNDEDDGHDRIHLLDGCDDHESVRVVGAATVLVPNVHVARVGAAAAIG